jgi:hypothetical protein
MSFLDGILNSIAGVKDSKSENKNETNRKRPAEVAKLPTIDEEYRRLKKQKLENAKKEAIKKPEKKEEVLETKSTKTEIKNSNGLSLSERTAAILNRTSREEKLPANPLIIDAETAKQAAKEISRHKVISSDLEWSGSKRECILSVVQVATPDNVYLFDIYLGGGAIFQAGLKDIMESKTILKVFHDCRWDSDVLYHQYKVRLDNVFDTQLGYAVFCRQQSSYTPLPVSLNSLLRHFAFGNINALKDEAHKAMSADPQFWLKRPMSDDMLNYAREDVKNLITVYRQLTAPMTQSNIALIMKYSLQYVNQFRSLENIEDREAFKGLDEKKENKNGENANTNVNETGIVNDEKKEEHKEGEVHSKTDEIVNNNNKDEVVNESQEKVRSELDLTKEKSPEKEAPATPNGNPVKSDRPLPKYGIPSWDKDCLISLQRQQNRRRK